MVLISAAEPSGDRLAAELVVALRGRASGLQFRGCVGPAMRAVGVEELVGMEEISAMGVAEVLARLPRILRARRTLSAALDARPDLFIGVDAPDFHLGLARRARAAGARTIGLVSPQVWAWRPARVDAIAQAWSQLLCLFAFEPALYAQAGPRHGCEVRFVGHPVVDRVPERGPVDPFHYGLLPGSRPTELARHLGPFLEAAAVLRTREPRARFSLVLPDALSARLPPLPAGIVRISSTSGLAGARAALTKSGTVTLELALMGVPMVVAHRVHPLTYILGRALVRGVRHIALPNVLAGREVVPERVQRFTPGGLAEDLLALPQSQPVDLSALGGSGAVERAADAILGAL